MQMVNVAAIKSFICGVAVGITVWSVSDYIKRLKQPIDKETLRKIKELLNKDKDRN